MQFLKTIPRLFTPQIPRSFYLPLLTANFASTDKNKQIISKTDRKITPIPDYNPADFQTTEPTQNTADFIPSSLVETRYVYSEKEGKLKEIPVVPSLKNKNELLKEKKAIEKSIKEAEALANLPAEEESLEETERLSKRMSRLGVCSRRQAERMIALGLIRVNGKKVESNVPVIQEDKITIFTPHGERMPMKEDTKLWIFNKPKGLICTHDDPMNRNTIFDYLRAKGFSDDHFISVGRLDYLSEGLILLTNDGELAQAMEQPSSQIERSYRVRVFGLLDAEKLQKIRRGAIINGVKYGPYFVEVEKKQSRNTWLRMRLSTGKNREIRRIMQKFSLRVNRLQRVSYGPYTLGRVESGDFVEVKITNEVKRVLYMRMRHKTEQKQQEEHALLEAAKQDQLQLGASGSQGQLPFHAKRLGSGQETSIVPRAVMTTRRIEEGIKQAQDETSKTAKRTKPKANKQRKNPFDLSEAQVEFYAKERKKSRSQYIRRKKAIRAAEKEKKIERDRKRSSSESGKRGEKKDFSRKRSGSAPSGEKRDFSRKRSDSAPAGEKSFKPRRNYQERNVPKKAEGGARTERKGGNDQGRGNGSGRKGGRVSSGSAQNKRIVSKKVQA